MQSDFFRAKNGTNSLVEYKEERIYNMHSIANNIKYHLDTSSKKSFLLCHLISWGLKALIYQRCLSLRMGSYLLKVSFISFAWCVFHWNQ